MKKKKNYRIVFALLVLFLIPIFGACGSRGEDTDFSVSASAGVIGQTEQKEDTLPELKIGCTLVAPYFYMGEDGNYTGIDVEIAEEACRRMGYEPSFTVVTWGEQETQVDSGNVDCIWSCFAMDGREQIYQWAGPYLYSQEVVVVPADSEIQDMQDLTGKTVAVRIASRSENYFMKVATPNVPQVAQILTYENNTDTFTAFSKGYVDAVAEHKLVLQEMTKDHAQLYRYLEPSFLTTKLGVAFSLNYDTDVVKTLNNILTEMNQDGTISGIAEKYGVEQKDLIGAGKNAE